MAAFSGTFHPQALIMQPPQMIQQQHPSRMMHQPQTQQPPHVLIGHPGHQVSYTTAPPPSQQHTVGLVNRPPSSIVQQHPPPPAPPVQTETTSDSTRVRHPLYHHIRHYVFNIRWF